MRGTISLLIGLGGLGLFTLLLVTDSLSQASYLACLAMTVFAALAILAFPRILELDVKNLRVVLSELRQEKKELNDLKQEIEEMYGGIENLKLGPYLLDSKKCSELGAGSGPVFTGAVMRYVAGCMTRERERLASIFINSKEPEALAAAILDNTKNDLVFKWVGPGADLNAPPKTRAEREAEKEAKTDSN